MRLGIDLDNTIVCYDQIFFQEAIRFGFIPKSLSPKKVFIKKYIRDNVGEEQWMFLQSVVYGQHVNEAKPYPGVVEFISEVANQFDVHIISHKTSTVIHDAKVDLIKAARHWLDKYGFTNMLSKDAIHFENSRKSKISRIRKVKCDIFIDDLIEIFLHPNFPKKTQKILFDPTKMYKINNGISVANSWEQISHLILNKTQQI